MGQQLRGGEFASSAKVNLFGNGTHGIDDFVALVESDAVLAVVCKPDGVADVESSAVGLYFA